MKRFTTLLLTLGIIVAMVANSADFFFRRPYYEFWDLAANSLAVIRAKHFTELYGSYSRWGFHHPGPVYFYIQAFGEWFFYDLLHLTPAQFNAQTLAHLCVMVSFYAAALMVFMRWLPERARRWFLPMALIVGALHFGAVSRMPSFDMLLGSSVFSSAWTAHALVFPFLCMLAAGASVAAGRAEDLPLLALADGFLIHAHIAAPLFVGPMTLLAYSGLLVTLALRERARAAADGPLIPVWRHPVRVLGTAWRAFPRWHVIAVVILGLFALPLVIDLFLGDGSNFHAVMVHLRTHHGDHKTLVKSFFYLVQFGAYRPYQAHQIMLKKFDGAGAYAYVWLHKKMYALWIVSILLVVWASLVRPALVGLGRWREEAGTPTDAGAAPAVPAGRTRFLAWTGAFLLLSVPLTLFWGIIQDGEMFYYSGWCNYAIYYFGLLIVLAEPASVIASRVGRWKNGALLTSPAWNLFERIAPAVAVVIVCVLHADRFRVRDPYPEINRAMHESNLRIVADAKARNPDGIKIFDFPFFSWPTTTGLGLEMKRQGQPFMVLDGYSVQFGQAQAWRPTPPETQHRMELWHFKLGKEWKLWVSGTPKWFVSPGKTLERQLAVARQEKEATGDVAFYPMLDDVQMRIGVPKVDPGDAAASLDFHKGGNGSGCSLYGFSDPETWGTWNAGTAGVMRLRSVPVDATKNVELVFDAHPFLAPDADVTSQRMGLAANGITLGPEAKLTEDGEVVYTVPGEIWNRTFGQSAGAALEFTFPDAASPAKLHPDSEKDDRQLGVGFRSVRFRTVQATYSQPALVLDGPARTLGLDFKPGGNAAAYQADGWFPAEPWGAWNNGHTSALRFHSKMVDGMHDVEITLNVHAVMATDSGISGQRVRLTMGEQTFDRDERTVETPGTVVFRVPGSVWNAAVAGDAAAELKLEWPDAVSPARIDPTGKEQDKRLLAVGVERMTFRDVATPKVAER